MKTPLVSIVLPTFNRSNYLARSIQSIMEQSYTDWELIAVDDASTDQTPRVLEQFASTERRIVVVRNTKNMKLPASLNIGFGHARGELFTWTSDDNLYRPNAISRMVSFLQADESISLVYSGMTQIDDGGAGLGYLHALPPTQIGRKCVVHACFLYRRMVHELLGGYREEMHYAEDYDFWLRAFCIFKLKEIDEDLYEYRSHLKSMSGERDRVQRATAMALLDALPLLSTVSRSVAADAALRLARFYMNNGGRFRAFGMALRACRLDVTTAVQERRILSQLIFGTRLTAALGIHDRYNRGDMPQSSLSAVAPDNDEGSKTDSSQR